MTSFNKVKWAVIHSFILYLSYLSLYKCNDEADSVFCKPINRSISAVKPYYEPVQPYVSRASEYVHERAIDPVNLKVSEVYEEYLLEHVDLVNKQYVNKYYPLIDANAIQPFKLRILNPAVGKLTLFIDDVAYPKLVEFGKASKKQAVVLGKKLAVHGKAAAIYSKHKIVERSTIFKRDLITVYVPAICEYFNNFLRFVNNIVKPNLISFYDQFLKTHLTKGYQLLKADVVVNFIKEYYVDLKESSLYLTTSNYIKALYKDLIPKNYDEVEDKKNFVKLEFNKIFDAGFKLSNDFQESFKNSNKMIKDKLYNKAITSSVSFTNAISSQISSSTTPAVSETTKDENDISKSISFWNSLVSKTCELAIEELMDEISVSEKATIELYSPKFTSELQDIVVSFREGYKEVTEVIAKINETDISRQEFRDILSKLSNEVADKTAKVKTTLEEASNNVSEYISVKRSKIIETLEDFSDFSIQEFSRELITDRKKDDQYWQNWKELNKIKETLYESREKLFKIKPELKDLDRVISGVQGNLDALVNECGQGLALLRAKANLQFQFKEEIARKEAEALLIVENSDDDQLIEEPISGELHEEVEPEHIKSEPEPEPELVPELEEEVVEGPEEELEEELESDLEGELQERSEPELEPELEEKPEEELEPELEESEPELESEEEEEEPEEVESISEEVEPSSEEAPQEQVLNV